MRATISLILSITVGYLLEAFSLNSGILTQGQVLSYFAFSTNNLLSGEAWTLVTGLYLHAGLVHLLGNMLFLFIFGEALEREVGGRRTVELFFFGGILTFIAGIPFYAKGTFLIGASAAIFTLSAAILLVRPTRLTIILLPVGLVAIIFFLLNVYEVSSGAAGDVAYISHVIGFLIGIPFGAAWSKQWLKNLGVTVLMLIIFIFIILITVYIFGI
jgi:rhomboid family protein